MVRGVVSLLAVRMRDVVVAAKQRECHTVEKNAAKQRDAATQRENHAMKIAAQQRDVAKRREIHTVMKRSPKSATPPKSA